VSLIEAMVVVVVLAVAVPSAMLLVNDSVSARADAVSVMRATTLATGVLEHVIADVYGGDAALGFDALADADTYLNMPTTGLRDRIASMTTMYEDMGLSYAVTIGPLVDSTGAESGNSAQDVFRVVTVTVTLPSSHTGSVQMNIGTMVTSL
jgi:hypothetical protein